MNITLEYQNKKKKETNGSNNNSVQENRNSKQIGWLTLNDITCHSYHMNLHCKYVQFLIVSTLHCNLVVRFTLIT